MSHKPHHSSCSSSRCPPGPTSAVLLGYGNPGIRGPEKTYDELSETITFGKGRYQVSLPWKTRHKSLSDNYQLSLRRLEGLLKRPRQAPDVLQKYDDTSRSKQRLWKTFHQRVRDHPSSLPCSHLSGQEHNQVADCI